MNSGPTELNGIRSGVTLNTPPMIVGGMVEDLGFAPALMAGIPQGHFAAGRFRQGAALGQQTLRDSVDLAARWHDAKEIVRAAQQVADRLWTRARPAQA